MNVAIYCGSAFGEDLIYANEAKVLVQALHKKGINVVYGGSKQGLMGVVADEAMRLGLSVTGVIPHSLVNKEVENHYITQLYKVDTMAQRKTKMESLCSGFIALPGGYGTFDELFEVLSGAQLGYHKNPCALYNINGYYDKLLEFLYDSVEAGFMDKRFVDMVIVSDNANELLDKMIAFKAVKAKWE